MATSPQGRTPELDALFGALVDVAARCSGVVLVGVELPDHSVIWARGAEVRKVEPQASGPDRVSRPRGSCAQSSGWGSLTAAELRVIRLVAAGLTNRAVAGRLLVSQHTVDSHLKHTYTKLGITSRVQLTRELLCHEPSTLSAPAGT